MKLSDYAFQRIKEFEGLELQAYQCAAGKWTIGYGHTKGVHEGMSVTKEQAENFLREDIEYFESRLEKEAFAEELTQGQWDALVSFIFNVGWSAFYSSTMRKKIAKDINDESIPNEFRRWVHAGGKRLLGLVRRREWEAQMYEWE